jgi:hypothetical protein
LQKKENERESDTPAKAVLGKKTPSRKSKPEKTDSRWHEKFNTVLATVSILVAVVGGIYTYQANYELKNIQQRAIETSLPAQLAIEYVDPDTLSERVVLKNMGAISLDKASVELKYFFVFKDAVVLSVPKLENLLQNDASILEKFKQKNLLVTASSLGDLLGCTSKFSINSIEPFDESDKGKSNERIIDGIATTCIQNAIIIGNLLEAKPVAQWKIDYRDTAAKRYNKTTLYVWINGKKDGQPRRGTFYRREELSNVIGGKKIITALTNYEENSDEVIFEN